MAAGLSKTKRLLSLTDTGLGHCHYPLYGTKSLLPQRNQYHRPEHNIVVGLSLLIGMPARSRWDMPHFTGWGLMFPAC